MRYVYLVYDDLHGLQCICADKDKATEKVNIYEIPKHWEPEYDDEDSYGYEGAAVWHRVEVE